MFGLATHILFRLTLWPYLDTGNNFLNIAVQHLVQTDHKDTVLTHTVCPRKSGYERMCQYLTKYFLYIHMIIMYYRYILYKDVATNPAQLVIYFSRYDPKRKRCCSQLLALFGLNQSFH